MTLEPSAVLDRDVLWELCEFAMKAGESFWIFLEPPRGR
jgi:hypothetical protein